MSLLPVLVWPDARLRARAEPVAVFDSALAQLAADMLETMYAAPGRGLAATQVGVMQRMFVMDCGWKTGPRDPFVFINPVLVATSSHLVPLDEGCLSLPGLFARVARPDRVTLAWLGVAAEQRQAEFAGFAATCVQHELDHLNGVLCIDHLDAEARAALDPALAGMGQP